MKQLLLFISIICVSALNAQEGQRHNHRWFFSLGSQVGLQFNEPNFNVNVTNLHAAPFSQGANITANNPITGNLMFYSNGLSVWDANHNVMPNGNGLNGNANGFASVKACYNPANCNQFFIFHSTAEQGVGLGPLYYSVVDMSLPGNGNAANPRGDILPTRKNIQLTPLAGEGVCIIEAPQPKTFYLITGVNPGNILRVWRINPAGFFQVGNFPLPGNTQMIRDIRFSPAANKISVVTAGNAEPVYVGNFNPNTGFITGLQPVPGTPFNPNPANFTFQLASEFSPDGSKLYITQFSIADGGRLVQYNLNAPATPVALIHNQAIPNNNPMLDMQTGPDGRIYVVHDSPGINYQFLGIVQNPNQAGIACNYVHQGLDLMANPGAYVSLPSFLSPNYRPEAAYQVINLDCFGTGASFNFQPFFTTNDPNFTGFTGTSIIYGPSAITNTLSNGGQDLNLTVTGNMTKVDSVLYKICDNHCFSLCDTGTILIIPQGVGASAIFNFNPRETQFFCPNDSIRLENLDPSISVTWNNSINSNFLWVKNPGWVYFSWSTPCADLNDSVFVNFIQVPEDGLIKDTILCANAGAYEIKIPDYGNIATYQWNTNSDSNSIVVYESGDYSVLINICKKNYYFVATITYLENDNRAFVPSAFTPNNDGINEEFKPKGNLVGQRNYLFEVFDRWGQPLFSTDKPWVGWNATHDNLNSVQKGTYIYKLSFQHPCTRAEFNEVGRFSLIR
jgi:gliding motility-associated-like protein